MRDTFQAAEALREKSKYRDALKLYLKTIRESGPWPEYLICAADTLRMVGDFAKAEEFYGLALNLTKISGDSSLALDATVGLALSKRALGDWKGALKLIEKAEKKYISMRDKEGAAFCTWAKAGTFRIKGDIPKAVKTYDAAMKMFKALKDDYGVGYCLCGLGGTTRVRGLYNESSKYYTSANKLFKKLGDSFGTAYSHCGIGNALRMKGKYKDSLAHFKKALLLYNRIGDIVSSAYTLWSIAKTHMMMGKYGPSRESLDAASKFFKKTGDLRGVIYYNMGVAELHFLNGRKKMAIKYAVSAFEEAKDMGFSAEKCHAATLMSILEDKKSPLCYEELGLSLDFKTIPMNIP